MKKIFPVSLVMVVIALISCQKKITEPELNLHEFKDHISYLASERLAGRYPGTGGDSLAAEYIRNDYKSNQLSLLGENGFQKFKVVTGNVVSPDNILEFDKEKEEQYKDFVPFPFSGSADLEKPVVFAGYGFDIDSE